MTGEVQQHIQNFLFHLGNEDNAKANKELETVINIKYQDKFNDAYNKVSKTTTTANESVGEPSYAILMFSNERPKNSAIAPPFKTVKEIAHIRSSKVIGTVEKLKKFAQEHVSETLRWEPLSHQIGSAAIQAIDDDGDIWKIEYKIGQ